MAGVCEGECMGNSPGDEPDLDERDSYMKPLKGEVRLWSSLQLKGHKGKIFCFSFLRICFSFTVAHFMA